MTAALAYSYYLTDDQDNSERYARLTESLILSSNYWQGRVQAFPQILTLCGFTSNDKVPKLLNIEVPRELIPHHYSEFFLSLEDRRELNGWKD